MPSSSHTAPSMIVGMLVSVWIGAGDSLSGRRLGGSFAGPDAVSVPANAALAAASWRRLFSAESVPAGVNDGFVASPSLLDYPAGAAQMVDHLIQIFLVSFGQALGMTCLGSSRFVPLSAVGRIGQIAVQAAMTSSDNVVEFLLLMVHTFSVLSFQLKKLR